jgi:hypothetical protein
MAKPSRFAELVSTVTRDVVEHPRDLSRFYAEKLGISRAGVARYVVKLENEGWIARSGPSTHPVFSPGYRRRVQKLYDIAGLAEDIAWTHDFRPYLNLRPNVVDLVGHGFTEMLNNAIDHSAGASVFCLADQSEEHISLIISDNGIGIFKKIGDALQLPDLRQALFELSKGKFTTDPARHTGEGVFFTSRMFNRFEIQANSLVFKHSDGDLADVLRDEPDLLPGGTAVHMLIPLNSERTTASVYAKFTDAPEDYDFSKTIVPMKLARFGDEQLISRSQAKRLIARFERFKVVLLDFEGVNEIGQAFADELFRVYGNDHPAVELAPINMTEQVQRMWLRVTAPLKPAS